MRKKVEKRNSMFLQVTIILHFCKKKFSTVFVGDICLKLAVRHLSVTTSCRLWTWLTLQRQFFYLFVQKGESPNTRNEEKKNKPIIHQIKIVFLKKKKTKKHAPTGHTPK